MECPLFAGFISLFPRLFQFAKDVPKSMVFRRFLAREERAKSYVVPGPGARGSREERPRSRCSPARTLPAHCPRTSSADPEPWLFLREAGEPCSGTKSGRLCGAVPTMRLSPPWQTAGSTWRPNTHAVLERTALTSRSYTPGNCPALAPAVAFARPPTGGTTATIPVMKVKNITYLRKGPLLILPV
jgi:hypothetical protein